MRFQDHGFDLDFLLLLIGNEVVFRSIITGIDRVFKETEKENWHQMEQNVFIWEYS